VDLHASLQIGADGDRGGEKKTSCWRDQRLRERERRRLMAIFAITEYARVLKEF